MNEKQQSRTLAIVFMIVFLDMVGFGILIPVIPLLLADPSSPYYILSSTTSVQTGYELLGLLLATFSLMQFLAAPILGQLSDRFGRKKLLAFSVAGSCIAYALFGTGIIYASLPLLFFARGLDGLTGGNISIAQAAVADITSPENRAKNFGLVGAAFGLGFIIGPFLGGKLSDPAIVSWFSASTPFFVAALVSFVEAALIVFVLPETIGKRKEGKGINPLQSVSNILKALSHESIRPILTTVFLFQSGFTFFTTFIAVYYIDKFGFTQGDIGNMFAYIGICVTLTQLYVIRRLPHNKEYEILRVALLVSSIMLFVYIFPTASWQLLLIIPVFSAFNGITQSYLPAVVSRSADANIQGEVLGLNSSVAALAQAIPPVIAGYFAAAFSPVMPLYVAGVIVFLSTVVFWIKQKRKLIDVSESKLWEKKSLAS